MSLRSFSIGVEIVFTNNELVDIKRNFISNASLFKRIWHEKNAPQAIFLSTKCAVGKTYQIQCAADQIF